MSVPEVAGGLVLWYPVGMLTPTMEDSMAWTEATRAEHGRLHDDRQDDLTDAEWMVIAPLIPRQGRMGRPRAADPRRVFDAIRSMLSSGCQWRLVPPCHPPSSTVRNRFCAWRNDGTLERRPDALRDRARAQAGRGSDGGDHRQSIGEDDGKRRALGTRCRQEDQGTETTHRGGHGRKPDRGACAPRRRAGSRRGTGGDRGPPEQGPGGVSKVFADGGYRGDRLRDRLKDLKLPDILEIVGKPKETKGFIVIPRRRVVARTFARRGRCRRLAGDFERSLESSLAWAQRAACRFLMRRVARGTRA